MPRCTETLVLASDAFCCLYIFIYHLAVIFLLLMYVLVVPFVKYYKVIKVLQGGSQITICPTEITVKIMSTSVCVT